MPHGLVIEVHALQEFLTIGGWCPHCLLPSVVRLPFVDVDAASLRPVVRGATNACRDCGRHWNDAGDTRP